MNITPLTLLDIFNYNNFVLDKQRFNIDDTINNLDFIIKNKVCSYKEIVIYNNEVLINTELVNLLSDIYYEKLDNFYLNLTKIESFDFKNNTYYSNVHIIEYYKEIIIDNNIINIKDLLNNSRLFYIIRNIEKEIDLSIKEKEIKIEKCREIYNIFATLKILVYYFDEKDRNIISKWFGLLNV